MLATSLNKSCLGTCRVSAAQNLKLLRPAQLAHNFWSDISLPTNDTIGPTPLQPQSKETMNAIQIDHLQKADSTCDQHNQAK